MVPFREVPFWNPLALAPVLANERNTPTGYVLAENVVTPTRPTNCLAVGKPNVFSGFDRPPVFPSPPVQPDQMHDRLYGSTTAA
jgi:hypothetical protein